MPCPLLWFRVGRSHPVSSGSIWHGWFCCEGSCQFWLCPSPVSPDPVFSLQLAYSQRIGLLCRLFSLWLCSLSLSPSLKLPLSLSLFLSLSQFNSIFFFNSRALLAWETCVNIAKASEIDNIQSEYIKWKTTKINSKHYTYRGFKTVKTLQMSYYIYIYSVLTKYKLWNFTQ